MTLNEMGGNIPGENFLCGNFPGGSFPLGEFDELEFFGWDFQNHFLHIMHLFLFFKKLSMNIIKFSTKRYTL